MECICCQEITEVVNKNNEIYEKEKLAEKPKCITESRPFETVCLNEWVLKIERSRYLDFYGRKKLKGLKEHEKKRKLACRQFVLLCWEECGKDIFVLLPSCALKRIRARFPSSDGSDVKS